MTVGLIINGSSQKLVDELVSKGINTRVLELHDDSLAEQYRKISEFMKHSKRYDIIHCIGSILPLMFARFVNAYLLITIVNQPSPTDLEICSNACRNCFFVSSDGVKAISGIDLVTEERVPEKETGTYYHDIYGRILRENPRENHRPWGHYEVLCEEYPDHKIKRITLWPGKRLSLQFHNKRSEHWFIVSGQARITRDKEQVVLGPFQSVDITVGAVHRIENIGDEPLVFIEVQHGDYFGEDDIVRIEDDFGRA